MPSKRAVSRNPLCLNMSLAIEATDQRRRDLDTRAAALDARMAAADEVSAHTRAVEQELWVVRNFARQADFVTDMSEERVRCAACDAPSASDLSSRVGHQMRLSHM